MSNWKPISTAPKNLSVLVHIGGQQFVAWLQDDETDEWHEEGEAESEFNGLWCVTDNKLGPFPLRGGRPDYWMALPDPPEAE